MTGSIIIAATILFATFAILDGLGRLTKAVRNVADRLLDLHRSTKGLD